MAYTPTEWKCGDTITAEKMNKLEQAVAQGGGGALFADVAKDGDGYSVLNKTLGEIKEAVHDGKQIVSRGVVEGFECYAAFSQFQFNADGGGALLYFDGRTLVSFIASTDSDYPSTEVPK